MKFRTALFSGILAIALFASQGCCTKSQTQSSNNITGLWQSVDFVTQPDDFQPGRRSWKEGDLFLKEFRAFENGTTSLERVNWANGWITNSEGGDPARYELRNIEGTTYLFLPWMSGDVVIRRMAPKYYVLKRATRAK